MKILCFASGLMLTVACAVALPDVNTADDSGLSLDEMSYLGKMYHNAFSNIYLEQNNLNLTDTDLNLITEAVTTSPQSIVGIEHIESLCIYFLETEREELDARKLVSILVDGSKQSEIVKFQFMKDTYEALTYSGKAIVDEQTQVTSFESAESLAKEMRVPSVDDSLQHFSGIPPETLIDQYSNVCNSNRIEELRSRINDPGNVFQYRTQR